MDKVLNKAYNYALRLVFTKNYLKALKIFDLILFSNYTCEEISDPEYFDDDVIDTLYAVYSIIMSECANKFEKIEKYINGKNIDIRHCQNLGIEEINNMA